MTTPTEQNQALILEAMKQNRNRILFFLSLVTYCLLAVLATTDRDLFFATGIRLPLLGVELPLLAFYIVMPIFIILAHFNVLYLFNKHIDNLSDYDLNKFFVGIFDFIALSKGDSFQKIIKFFVFFVLYLLPLITLYLFWWCFNTYQDLLISRWHIVYLLLDSIIIALFIEPRFKKISILLDITIIVCLMGSTIIQNKIEKGEFPRTQHPKLSLSGEQLVNFDRDKLLVLQSLNKEKHKNLALYQPAFDLNGRSFKYANFSNSTLINVNFSNANLQEADLYNAELQGADLRKAQLQGVDLRKAQLQGVDLRKAQLQGVDWREAQLQGANLYRVQLQGANLIGVQLQGANLIGAELQGADLQKMNLQGADLFGAKLQGADLRKAQLQGVDLSWTELQGADLRDAQLQGADLSWIELQGANLYKAQLQGADLIGAQLQGANLYKAQLQGANLNGAKLQGANLDVAQLQGVYSRLFDSLNFVERINQQTNKKTDRKSLEEQYKPLEAEQKEKIIAELSKINKSWIKYAIKRIENAGDTLDLSKIEKTDSYNEQQAQKWIEQYKKDTSDAKKRTD